MTLLLTSAGIKNASIHDALVDLLGEPIAESNAPFMDTGQPLTEETQTTTDPRT
jgi:dipeptidase E